jgi:hypothetical protein
VKILGLDFNDFSISPLDLGVAPGTVGVANNDFDENPYRFSITAEAQPGYTVSGVVNGLEGNGLDIADGLGSTVENLFFPEFEFPAGIAGRQFPAMMGPLAVLPSMGLLECCHVQGEAARHPRTRFA